MLLCKLNMEYNRRVEEEAKVLYEKWKIEEEEKVGYNK